MKIPGPDHPITLTPATTRWRATVDGHLIADTAEAIVLQEANYPPVVYFPRKDVEMAYMGRTDHTTHCPYKGDASYYTITRDGQVMENAVWTYETPYPAMSQIQDMVAFYPNFVEVHAVDDPKVRTPRSEIDEAILHTDSGAGASQRQHWPPNVEGPEGVEGGVR